MEKKEPILTILVCAYNFERYICETLDGILSQETDFSFVILITDDASTDKTRSKIKEYIDRYPELFITVYNDKNLGLTATLKKAIPLLKTKYTCLLGGDDYWIDNKKLQKQVDFLEAHPNVSFLHTGFKRWMEASGSWGKDCTKWNWKIPQDREDRIVSFLNNDFSGYPCASTSCLRTDFYLMGYNNYPQLLEYGVGEGILLHTSMCLYGGDYYFMPDITTVYRCRERSLSHFVDAKETLSFQLDYFRLKLKAIELLNIPSTKYIRVVKKDLDNAFVTAYRNNLIAFYQDRIGQLGLSSALLKRNLFIAKYPIWAFLYYWYHRIWNRIKYSYKALH